MAGQLKNLKRLGWRSHAAMLDGKSITQIAKELHHTPKSIRKALKAANVTTRKISGRRELIGESSPTFQAKRLRKEGKTVALKSADERAGQRLPPQSEASHDAHGYSRAVHWVEEHYDLDSMNKEDFLPHLRTDFPVSDMRSMLEEYFLSGGGGGGGEDEDEEDW